MELSPRRSHALVFTSLAALAGAVAWADQAGPPAPRPFDRIHAEGDFIDDPFAISDDGTRIAWITTDGATHSKVHLAKIVASGGGGDKKAVEFPYSSIT